MKVMKLDEFLMELDGKDYNDGALLNIMFYQLNNLTRRSQNPVAFFAFKRREMVVSKDGFWGEDEVCELYVYTKTGDVFEKHCFASKPIFDTHQTDINDRPIFSEYCVTQLDTRRAAEFNSALLYDLCANVSEKITRANYSLNDKIGSAKWLIDNTFALWNKDPEYWDNQAS